MIWKAFGDFLVAVVMTRNEKLGIAQVCSVSNNLLVSKNSLVLYLPELY